MNYRPLTGGSRAGSALSRRTASGSTSRFAAASRRARSPWRAALRPRSSCPFRVGYVVDASKSRSSLLMVGLGRRLGGHLRRPAVVRPRAGRWRPQAGLDASGPPGLRMARSWPSCRYDLPSRLGVAARPTGRSRRSCSSPRTTLWWVDLVARRHAPALRSSQEADTLQHWILEIPAAGGTPRRLFRGFGGDWSPDGRAFVFSDGGASAGWGWARRGRSREPRQPLRGPRAPELAALGQAADRAAHVRTPAHGLAGRSRRRPEARRPGHPTGAGS